MWRECPILKHIKVWTEYFKKVLNICLKISLNIFRKADHHSMGPFLLLDWRIYDWIKVNYKHSKEIWILLVRNLNTEDKDVSGN